MKRFFVLAFIFVFWVFLTNTVQAQVLITEIMPDPTTAQDTSEWLEIYNYSPFAIPLNQLNINNKEISGNTELIQPNSTLLITKNLQSFQAEFGSLPAASAAISLANSGGIVTLQYQGNNIDSFTYPTAVVGKSWQRLGPLCTPTSWGTITANTFIPTASCWPAETEQTAVVEVTTDINGESELLSLETVQIFGWQKVEQFTLGNKVTQFLVGDTVILYSYIDHKLTKYISENISALPFLDIEAEISKNDLLQTLNLIVPQTFQDYEINELEIIFGKLILKLNNYVIKPGNNTINVDPPIKLTCLIDNCLPKYEVKINDLEWANGYLPYTYVQNSTTSQTSSSVSSSSVSYSASSSMPNYKTVEISEVFAAPKTGEAEWLELYNYGNQAVNLVGWYIQDTKGKHILNGEIQPGAYMVVDNLKITLNNTGELLELFTSDIEKVDNWQQPEVKSETSAIRILNGNRHNAEIFLSEQSSPGKENEPVLATSDQFVSSHTTSTALVTSNNGQAETILGSADLISPADLQDLDLTIRDFTAQVGEVPKLDVSLQMGILFLAAIAEILLIASMLWRSSKFKHKVKSIAAYVFHNLKNFVLGPDAATKRQLAKRSDHLEALRY